VFGKDCATILADCLYNVTCNAVPLTGIKALQHMTVEKKFMSKLSRKVSFRAAAKINLR